MAAAKSAKTQGKATAALPKYVREAKTPDGKSIYWVEIDRRRPDGTHFRKTSKYTTLEKALAAREKWLELLDTNQSPETWTLKAWAEHCFENVLPFPHLNKKGLKPNTIHGYRLLFDKWVKDTYGTVDLRSLTPEHVARLLHREMGQRHGRDSDTIANVRNMLSKLYSVAEGFGKIELGKNPCKIVAAPRNERKYDEQGYEVPTTRNFTEKEKLEFLNKAHYGGSWAYLGFLMGFEMGLRTGEILGFDLRQVDWQKCLYAVREQVNRRRPKWGERSKGGKLKPGSVGPMGGLKKDGSYRTLYIPEPIMGELRRIRSEAPFTTYLFVHPNNGEIRKGAGGADGRHRTPDDFSEEFATHARAAGLFGCVDSLGRPKKNPTPHDMRHTFGFHYATVKRVPEATLMKMMGHKDPSTMKKYYIVADNDDVIAAMKLA